MIWRVFGNCVISRSEHQECVLQRILGEELDRKHSSLRHGPYNGFSLESAESAEVGPCLGHAQFACTLKLLSLLFVFAHPQGPIQQQTMVLKLENTSFYPTQPPHASFTPGSKGLANLVARHCYILSAH